MVGDSCQSIEEVNQKENKVLNNESPPLENSKKLDDNNGEEEFTFYVTFDNSVKFWLDEHLLLASDEPGVVDVLSARRASRAQSFTPQPVINLGTHRM